MALHSPGDGRATVAIIGIGNIGGVVAAALLAADRHNVMACARNPIKRLVLESPDGTVQTPLSIVTDPADAEPVDWVLLCTKTHQTPSTAPWLSRLCNSSTRVAVLQNGIDHVSRLTPLVAGATVIPTIVYYNGERLAEDHFRFRPVGNHDLAMADDAGGQAFADLLGCTPFRVLLSTDFKTLAWLKLLINAVANPITALTLQRQAVLRRDDVRALSIAVLDEAVAVARADGAVLAADQSRLSLATLLTYPPEVGTSMYFDRLAGRTLEVDALTGAIVAAGERLGIATPLNRSFQTLLRAISDAAEKA